MTLSEAFHSVILISHACLPAKLPTLEFPAVVDRLLWQLNLPHVFKHRLNIILESIFDPVCDIGKDYLAELCPLVEDPGMKIGRSKKIGFSSFFRKIFKIEHSKHSNFITPEVKAMGVILFALKLVFGLDGKREANMETSEKLYSSRNFDFSEWIIQLRLRISAWKGMSIKNILNSQKILDEKIFKFENSSGRINGIGETMKDTRNLDSFNVIPHRPKNALKNRIFYNIFKNNDFSRNPRNDISEESIFAPLRSFTRFPNPESQRRSFTMAPQETSEEDTEQYLDKDKERIFFMDFSDCEMNYEVNSDADEVFETISNDFKDDINAEEKETWQHLFPCAEKYIVSSLE